MSGWLLGAGILVFGLGCLFLALWGALWWFVPRATPWSLDDADDADFLVPMTPEEAARDHMKLSCDEHNRRQEFTDAWLKKKAKQ